jgi:hypothetical protein
MRDVLKWQNDSRRVRSCARPIVPSLLRLLVYFRLVVGTGWS